MKPKTLFLATRNMGKITELRELLADLPGIEIVTALDRPELPEPEETASTFRENAELKAREYAEKTGYACLADDSGLVVDALGGLPGVRSARYAETEELRIQRLLTELQDVPDQERTARFVCAAVLADANGAVAWVEGKLEGMIGHEPRGTNGFGYDPVFILPGTEKTLAEIDSEEKNAISHRGQALAKMRKHLLDYFTGESMGKS